VPLPLFALVLGVVPLVIAARLSSRAGRRREKLA
jgi:hypothetical protein